MTGTRQTARVADFIRRHPGVDPRDVADAMRRRDAASKAARPFDHLRGPLNGSAPTPAPVTTPAPVRPLVTVPAPAPDVLPAVHAARLDVRAVLRRAGAAGAVGAPGGRAYGRRSARVGHPGASGRQALSGGPGRRGRLSARMRRSTRNVNAGAGWCPEYGAGSGPPTRDRAIIRASRSGMSQRKIAARFELSRNAVRHVLDRDAAQLGNRDTAGQRRQASAIASRRRHRLAWRRWCDAAPTDRGPTVRRRWAANNVRDSSVTRFSCPDGGAIGSRGPFLGHGRDANRGPNRR